MNYGMKAQKLAFNLDISVEEAEELMAKYMGKWTAVGEFFAATQNSLEQTGYVYTYLGRRRYLPDVGSSVAFERWRAGRQGANAIIQGCQPASTKVLTSNGYQCLGDIPYQGIVWTGMSWAPYTKLDRGEWQIARIHFDNGQVLTCDTRHKVLTVGSEEYTFKEFGELQVGDRVAFSLAQPLEYGMRPEGMSADDFYWMGFATGNGCTSMGEGHPNAISITFGDRKGRYGHHDQVARYLRWVEGHRWAAQRPQSYPNKTSVTVEGRKVCAEWESWGYGWGKTAAHKRVPVGVWGASLEDRKSFLVGLLDANGTIGATEHAPCLHLCQRDLLEEVMILARTCGVQGRITGPYHDDKGHTSYQLHFVGKQAAEHLGYGNAPRKNTIPGMGLPTKVAQRVMEEAPLPSTESQKTLHHRVRTGGTLGAYTAKDLLQGRSVPELYAASAITRLEVLDRVEPTYTLAVEHDSHRFDSEGVITKNTAADIARMSMLRLAQEGQLSAFGWRILSQIHDELLFEGPEETVNQVIPIIQDAMQRPFPTPFAAPLRTKPTPGHSWYDAK